METPTITTSCYSSTSINADDFGDVPQWANVGDDYGKMHQALQPRRAQVFGAIGLVRALNQQEEQTMPSNQKRVVKVFVADPDDKVPADKSLLYEGKEHVTDLTDQELFFEVDIKPLLEKHNAERVKIVDKPSSQKFGKEVYLEPAKIRDLRMTVVVVAQF